MRWLSVTFGDADTAVADRERSCGNKVRHDSREHAVQVAGKMRSGKDLEPYPCNYCGGWHLGHQIRSPLVRWLLRKARGTKGEE